MKQPVDVLLLDDDRDVCVMAEAMLQYSGYIVHSFSSPHQLQQVLNGYNPEMLLMDMLLSGTDGRDICRRLKADAVTGRIKIIMMSAHPDGEKSCREAGADDFIAKPFEMDHFIGRIKEQLMAKS